MILSQTVIVEPYSRVHYSKLYLIRYFSHTFSKAFLKEFMDCDLIVSSGRLVHILTTLWEKEFKCNLAFALGF